jgi:hypothetical protein
MPHQPRLKKRPGVAPGLSFCQFPSVLGSWFSPFRHQVFDIAVHPSGVIDEADLGIAIASLTAENAAWIVMPDIDMPETGW